MQAEIRPTDGFPGSVAARARLRDAEIVRACRAGDEASWAALVNRFSAYVYAILARGFRLTGDAAEDVFQDVFTTVFRQLPDLEDAEAVKPWIAQVARRRAIDRLRTSRPTVELDAAPEIAREDERLQSIEDALTVHRALAELPEGYRDVVERFFVYDESYRTIGDALGIAPGTVASRISRGLALLRDVLAGTEFVASER